MRPVGPADFRFNFHARGSEMLPPGLQTRFGNSKGHVSGPARSVQGNGPAVDYNTFAFGMLRIKDQQNTLLATKRQVTPGHRKDFFQAQGLPIEFFRRLQVIRVERGFQNAIEMRSYSLM